MLSINSLKEKRESLVALHLTAVLIINLFRQNSQKVKILPRLPKTAHSNTPTHVYVTMWKYLQKTWFQ